MEAQVRGVQVLASGQQRWHRMRADVVRRTCGSGLSGVADIEYLSLHVAGATVRSPTLCCSRHESADGIDSIDVLWLRDRARLAVLDRLNAVVISVMATDRSRRLASWRPGLTMATALPVPSDEPEFVVKQPLAGPRDGGARDVHVGRPFTREVQA